MLQTLWLFYILLHSLNDTSKGICFISKLIFVLNKHKDTCLSTIEFIRSWKETMSNCQSIFIFCEIVYFKKNLKLKKMSIWPKL